MTDPTLPSHETAVAVMSGLAARWSKALMRQLPPRSRDDGQHEIVGSVLRPGASEDEIVQAERRIGRSLPPSYRAFLAVSNGAYAHDEGATAGWEGGPGFLPVNEIGWLRDQQPSTADLYAEGFGWDHSVTGPFHEGSEIPDWAAFACGLVIAKDRCPGLTVLVPDVDPELDGAEWQLWNVSKDASCRYSSFGALLRHVIERATPVYPSVQEVHVLLAEAASDSDAYWRLSRTATPQAVPLLVEALDSAEGLVRFAAARGLAMAGGDEAVDALFAHRATFAPLATDLLITVADQRVRDRFFAERDCMALLQTGDVRAATLAREVLADESLEPSDRAHGAQVLGDLAGPQDAQLVASATEAWTGPPAFIAAFVCEQLGDHDTAVALMTRLADEPSIIRDSAKDWLSRRQP